jgi:hypothetical protein
MLLGLQAQPRGDTGLSPAEAVFGTPSVLPNEFLQNKEMSVDAIIKNFSKTLHVHAVSLPRHNFSSAQLPSELPGELLSAPLVWVRCGGVIPPLQPLYIRWPLCRSVPRTPLLHHLSRVPGRGYRLQGLHGCRRPPGSPRRRGRPLGLHPGGPAATKWVLFSDPLVSSPSPPALRRDGHETIFLPGEEVFACPGPAAPSQVPQTWYPSVNGHRHRGWTSDLFSSQPRPELGGSPVDTCLHPWQRSNQSGVLQ